MLNEPGVLEQAKLDEYFRDCVIGGAGSFMIPVRDHRHLTEAIRTKIVREIADLANENPWVQEDSFLALP